MALTKSISKKIVLMVFSPMKGRMAPTAHGPFNSVNEAVEMGKNKIKYGTWTVSEETTRLLEDGKEEVSYKNLTKEFKGTDE